MSDFMALLMYQQNERELEIALERRRLQKEAMAAKMPARRASGGWHRFWPGPRALPRRFAAASGQADVPAVPYSTDAARWIMTGLAHADDPGERTNDRP